VILAVEEQLQDKIITDCVSFELRKSIKYAIAFGFQMVDEDIGFKMGIAVQPVFLPEGDENRLNCFNWFSNLIQNRIIFTLYNSTAAALPLKISSCIAYHSTGRHGQNTHTPLFSFNTHSP
jgi:hypothetical protein